MSKKEQAEFLFAVLKHTTLNLNVRHLSAACDLSLGATQMRMTRLRRKLKRGHAKIEEADLEFLEKVWDFSEGKTDVQGVASELGMKSGAVSMRLSRLKKKIASAGRRRGAGGNRECIAMQEAESKKVKGEHDL
jgi:hypothetical protein